jgi:hypothetical protein
MLQQNYKPQLLAGMKPKVTTKPPRPPPQPPVAPLPLPSNEVITPPLEREEEEGRRTKGPQLNKMQTMAPTNPTLPIPQAPLNKLVPYASSVSSSTQLENPPQQKPPQQPKLVSYSSSSTQLENPPPQKPTKLVAYSSSSTQLENPPPPPQQPKLVSYSSVTKAETPLPSVKPNVLPKTEVIPSPLPAVKPNVLPKTEVIPSPQMNAVRPKSDTLGQKKKKGRGFFAKLFGPKSVPLPNEAASQAIPPPPAPLRPLPLPGPLMEIPTDEELAKAHAIAQPKQNPALKHFAPAEVFTNSQHEIFQGYFAEPLLYFQNRLYETDSYINVSDAQVFHVKAKADNALAHLPHATEFHYYLGGQIRSTISIEKYADRMELRGLSNVERFKRGVAMARHARAKYVAIDDNTGQVAVIMDETQFARLKPKLSRSIIPYEKHDRKSPSWVFAIYKLEYHDTNYVIDQAFGYDKKEADIDFVKPKEAIDSKNLTEMKCSWEGKWFKFEPHQYEVINQYDRTSESAGLLIMDSTGAGKTCKVTNLISNNFQHHQYELIWVTPNSQSRTQLWEGYIKDMCSVAARKKLDLVRTNALSNGKTEEEANQLRDKEIARMTDANNQNVFADLKKTYGIGLTKTDTSVYKEIVNALAAKLKLPNRHITQAAQTKAKKITGKLCLVIDEAHNILSRSDKSPWHEIFEHPGFTQQDIYGPDYIKYRFIDDDKIRGRDLLAYVLYQAYQQRLTNNSTIFAGQDIDFRFFPVSATIMNNDPNDLFWIVNLLHREPQNRLPLVRDHKWDDYINKDTYQLTPESLLKLERALDHNTTYAPANKDPTKFAQKVISEVISVPLFQIHYQQILHHVKTLQAQGVDHEDIYQRFFQLSMMYDSSNHLPHQDVIERWYAEFSRTRFDATPESIKRLRETIYSQYKTDTQITNEEILHRKDSLDFFNYDGVTRTYSKKTDEQLTKQLRQGIVNPFQLTHEEMGLALHQPPLLLDEPPIAHAKNYKLQTRKNNKNVDLKQSVPKPKPERKPRKNKKQQVPEDEVEDEVIVTKPKPERKPRKNKKQQVQEEVEGEVPAKPKKGGAGRKKQEVKDGVVYGEANIIGKRADNITNRPNYDVPKQHWIEMFCPVVYQFMTHIRKEHQKNPNQKYSLTCNTTSDAAKDLYGSEMIVWALHCFPEWFQDMTNDLSASPDPTKISFVYISSLQKDPAPKNNNKKAAPAAAPKNKKNRKAAAIQEEQEEEENEAPEDPRAKGIRDNFNDTKLNPHGERIKLFIYDANNREGIDLYDVPILYMIEPCRTRTEFEQTSSRIARMCKSKNQKFYHGFGAMTRIVLLCSTSSDGQFIFEKVHRETLHLERCKGENLCRVVFNIAKRNAVDYEGNKHLDRNNIQIPFKVHRRINRHNVIYYEGMAFPMKPEDSFPVLVPHKAVVPAFNVNDVIGDQGNQAVILSKDVQNDTYKIKWHATNKEEVISSDLILLHEGSNGAFRYYDTADTVAGMFDISSMSSVFSGIDRQILEFNQTEMQIKREYTPKELQTICDTMKRLHEGFSGNNQFMLITLYSILRTLLDKVHSVDVAIPTNNLEFFMVWNGTSLGHRHEQFIAHMKSSTKQFCIAFLKVSSASTYAKHTNILIYEPQTKKLYRVDLLGKLGMDIFSNDALDAALSTAFGEGITVEWINGSKIEGDQLLEARNVITCPKFNLSPLLLSFYTIYFITFKLQGKPISALPNAIMRDLNNPQKPLLTLRFVELATRLQEYQDYIKTQPFYEQDQPMWYNTVRAIKALLNTSPPPPPPPVIPQPSRPKTPFPK